MISAIISNDDLLHRLLTSLMMCCGSPAQESGFNDESHELCAIIEFRWHIQGRRIQPIEHFSVAVIPSRHYFLIFASRESLACIKHWCHFSIRSMCVRCTYRTPFACISLSHQRLSYCCKGMSRQPAYFGIRVSCSPSQCARTTLRRIQPAFHTYEPTEHTVQPPLPLLVNILAMIILVSPEVERAILGQMITTTLTELSICPEIR